MEGLTVGGGLASLAILSGLALSVGAFLSGRPHRRPVPPHHPLVTLEHLADATEASPVVDPPTIPAAPTPVPHNDEPTVTHRRADVLTGLQLVLLLGLLVGGVAFTRVITADQLLMLLGR